MSIVSKCVNEKASGPVHPYSWLFQTAVSCAGAALSIEADAVPCAFHVVALLSYRRVFFADIPYFRRVFVRHHSLGFSSFPAGFFPPFFFRPFFLRSIPAAVFSGGYSGRLFRPSFPAFSGGRLSTRRFAVGAGGRISAQMISRKMTPMKADARDERTRQ